MRSLKCVRTSLPPKEIYEVETEFRQLGENSSILNGIPSMVSQLIHFVLHSRRECIWIQPRLPRHSLSGALWSDPMFCKRQHRSFATTLACEPRLRLGPFRPLPSDLSDCRPPLPALVLSRRAGCRRRPSIAHTYVRTGGSDRTRVERRAHVCFAVVRLPPTVEQTVGRCSLSGTSSDRKVRQPLHTTTVLDRSVPQTLSTTQPITYETY